MALKESSLREERLWPSAQKIKAGEGSREEHAELVNTIKPVRPYAQPVPPASDEEVHDALSKDKKPNAFAPRAIPKGAPVAVRLDIPAYEQKNTWVVSVHHPKSDFTAGPVIGYDSVAHIDNPRFGVHPTGALNIASGKPKSTIATVHGNWRSTTPEKAYALAQTIHENPEWRQVGMDPERHSYFYDRETQQPVIAADEALHIGPLVYAKNPVYDKPENYKFADGGAADYIPHDDKLRAKNLKDFHGKTPKAIKEGRWLHGTDQNFQNFKAGQSGAIFVTQNPKFANKYAEKNYNVENVSPNVMPVHVRAEKPFDYENKKHIAALYEELGPDLIMDPYLHSFMDEVREGHWGAIESSPIQNAIKAMGHDSFYVKEFGIKNLGVYDPSQIKSATGNQGTFDQSNPDITKRDGGEVDDDGITAYHGSPHDFEQFDINKIGTGEGAQAYGHGLYFAESEPVAEGYRNRLSGYYPGSVKIGGEEHPHWSRREVANSFAKLGYDPETSVFAAHLINEHQGDLDSAVNSLLDFKPVEEGKFGETEKINDNLLKALMEAEPVNYKGHMYEVHIKSHPDHFLDWDKPLGEQSEHVRDAAEKALLERGIHPFKVQHMVQKSSGKDVVHSIIHGEWMPHMETVSSQNGKIASDILAHHGVKGIKYLDAGSRDAGEGSRNYVVFDHNHVAVKRKYAQGGVVG
jgi:hypothetical protein